MPFCVSQCYTFGVLSRIAAAGVNPTRNDKAIRPVRASAKQFLYRLPHFGAAAGVLWGYPDDLVVIRVLMGSQLVT
jgi:hypothetical protein